MGRAAVVRRQTVQHRVIFPDFSAFQMTVDVAPVQACQAGAGDDPPARRLPRQETLGPEAWPGFTPKASPDPGTYRGPDAGSRV